MLELIAERPVVATMFDAPVDTRLDADATPDLDPVFEFREPDALRAVDTAAGAPIAPEPEVDAATRAVEAMLSVFADRWAREDAVLEAPEADPIPALQNGLASARSANGGAVSEAARWWWPAIQNDAPPAEADPDQTPSFSASDFTGNGQTIVVIDDGNSQYYDQSATVFEYDFYGDGPGDPDATVGKIDSHGSWVAQTALSVANGAQIVHLKVFPDGSGGATFDDVEEALDFVIENAETWDIAAVNLSLGYGNAASEATTVLSDEFAELDELGIFSVVAAGNMGQLFADGVNVLAADPNVIAVSAVDDADEFAFFSQKSPELTDIAAPGVDIPMETIWGTELEVSGTSFSAPAVSGAAARLQEASLALTGELLTDEEFVEILQLSGTPVSGYEDGGPDGYVVADADAALEYFIANASDYGDTLFV